MKKGVWLFALALQAALCGCGPSADSLVKESIKCWDEAARVLESVDGTNASIKEAQGKLQAVLARMSALNAKAAKQGLAPEDLERIESDNQKASSEALARFNDAAKKAAAMPGGSSLVGRFSRQARGGI